MQRWLISGWVAACGCLMLCGADWPQFRGTGSSVATDAQLPTVWDEQTNVRWKVDLPGRGPSSPIVVDGRVIVTCSDGVDQDRLLVMAFDAGDGRELWRRQFWATGRTLSHPQSANAAPTPASDGKRIFAFYSSNDLICLDLDGNLLWYRGLAYDYPKAGNDIGMSSSPLVVGQTVVVQVENQGDSFAAGLDTASGEERWRVAREPQANWASPIRLPAAGPRNELVLLQSPSMLTAHEPATGREVWRYEARCSGIPSAATSGEAIFLPAEGITRLNVPGMSEPTRQWSSNRLGPSSPSPILHEGRLYTITSGGVLKCGDAASGEELWVLRIDGTHWATPVLAGGLLYCINFDGVAKVVDPSGAEGKIVATNQFGESIQGSPAVAGNALFVRSDKHLWKIAAP
ncbi:MAG: PQQ-binding-like beta-propeller repeat protein [Pirellulaceae bacterium]|nr:PQQ-binding-like beta-propeller repeat protein [Pirellulaceae bacterium]